jgi:hypothetical protein
MRGGGKDGWYTALATVGLALATLGLTTSGSIAWVARLGGFALTATAALGLAISVLRQRSK